MQALQSLFCLLVVYETVISSSVPEHDDHDPDLLKSSPVDRYFLGPESVRRDEAQLRCLTNGWRLAGIRTLEDRSQLGKGLEKNSNVFWIGGIFRDISRCRAKPFDETCWKWDADNETLNAFNPEMVPFSENVYLHTPSRASALVVAGGDEIEVDHQDGSRIYPYICDREPTLPTQPIPETTPRPTSPPCTCPPQRKFCRC